MIKGMDKYIFNHSYREMFDDYLWSKSFKGFADSKDFKDGKKIELGELYKRKSV